MHREHFVSRPSNTEEYFTEASSMFITTEKQYIHDIRPLHFGGIEQECYKHVADSNITTEDKTCICTPL